MTDDEWDAWSSEGNSLDAASPEAGFDPSVFDEELANVDVDDWNIDADLIWGTEDADLSTTDPGLPDIDLDLPMA